MAGFLSAPDWRRLGRRAWALVAAILPTVLIFTIAGPVAGYFAVLVPVAGSALPGPSGILNGLLGIFALMPVGIPFAVVLGYLPASLTGLLLALVDLFVDLRTFRVPAAIALGALVTVTLLHTTVGREETATDLGYVQFAAVAGATGAIAAAICALLAPRRAAPPPADPPLRLTACANSSTNKP